MDYKGSDRLLLQCPVCYTEREAYRAIVTVASLEELAKDIVYCGQCHMTHRGWVMIEIESNYTLGYYSDGTGYVWQKIGSKPPDRIRS